MRPSACKIFSPLMVAMIKAGRGGVLDESLGRLACSEWQDARTRRSFRPHVSGHGAVLCLIVVYVTITFIVPCFAIIPLGSAACRFL